MNSIRGRPRIVFSSRIGKLLTLANMALKTHPRRTPTPDRSRSSRGTLARVMVLGFRIGTVSCCRRTRVCTRLRWVGQLHGAPPGHPVSRQEIPLIEYHDPLIAHAA